MPDQSPTPWTPERHAEARARCSSPPTNPPIVTLHSDGDQWFLMVGDWPDMVGAEAAIPFHRDGPGELPGALDEIERLQAMDAAAAEAFEAMGAKSLEAIERCGQVAQSLRDRVSDLEAVLGFYADEASHAGPRTSWIKSWYDSDRGAMARDVLGHARLAGDEKALVETQYPVEAVQRCSGRVVRRRVT